LNTDTVTTLRVQYLSKPKQPYVTPPDPYTSVASIALLTAPVGAPIIPYDFSKPYFPSTAIDKTQPPNINLFTNPIPFYPVDLSKPFFPGNVPAAALPVNPNLYVVVTGVPFIPIDFSKTYFPRSLVDATQVTNQNLFQNPGQPPNDCGRHSDAPTRQRGQLFRPKLFRRYSDREKIEGVFRTLRATSNTLMRTSSPMADAG
jgi:hypothetical protein